MSEHSESTRRGQGPVAVITFLFGLLLGLAGGAGIQLQPDPGSARLTHGETMLRGAGLRLVRPGEEQPDADEALATLTPEPRLVTQIVSVRPGSSAIDQASSVAPARRDAPYQARAPPAAA